jgi:CubicO group peptidase (beta-lactamase class C family)
MRSAAFVLGAVMLLFSGRSAGAANDFAFTLFEQYLESLRQQAGIPAISTAIIQDTQIVWERGLGFQDVENSIRATPDTPYLVGDLTQTLSAVLLLRQAERGRVDLDDPITAFGASVPESEATIGHLLAHTSEGRPGAAFHYNAGRFAALTGVIETTNRGLYKKALATAILEPLSMRDSVPGVDFATDVPQPGFDESTLDRYRSILRRMARSYRVDRGGRPVRTDPPQARIDASGGLVSTVRDLARFDEALSLAAADDNFLLQQRTVSLAWTPVTVSSGLAAPTGLGWFVQNYNGERIVWHFGKVSDSFSGLMIKVPNRGLTMIMLANSDGLAAPFGLERGDVTSSFFGRLFLRIFV